MSHETAKVTDTGLTRHNGVNGGVGFSTRWFINCTITAPAPKASLRMDSLNFCIPPTVEQCKHCILRENRAQVGKGCI